MLRVQPNIVAKSIPFTMEADSLNCCVLGEDVTPDQPEFALFIREVVREMTTKAGQKCTAIRRIIVPQALVNAVSDALVARLQKVVVGDPAQEGVKMGALVNAEQRADVQENVTIDMEKVDFKALQGISGINVSAEDAKKGITMAQMELVMKAAGFKEVK